MENHPYPSSGSPAEPCGYRGHQQRLHSPHTPQSQTLQHIDPNTTGFSAWNASGCLPTVDGKPHHTTLPYSMFGFGQPQTSTPTLTPTLEEQTPPSPKGCHSQPHVHHARQTSVLSNASGSYGGGPGFHHQRQFSGTSTESPRRTTVCLSHASSCARSIAPARPSMGLYSGNPGVGLFPQLQGYPHPSSMSAQNPMLEGGPVLPMSRVTCMYRDDVPLGEEEEPEPKLDTLDARQRGKPGVRSRQKGGFSPSLMERDYTEATMEYPQQRRSIGLVPCYMTPRASPLMVHGGCDGPPTLTQSSQLPPPQAPGLGSSEGSCEHTQDGPNTASAVAEANLRQLEDAPRKSVLLSSVEQRPEGNFLAALKRLQGVDEEESHAEGPQPLARWDTTGCGPFPQEGEAPCLRAVVPDSVDCEDIGARYSGYYYCSGYELGEEHPPTTQPRQTTRLTATTHYTSEDHLYSTQGSHHLLEETLAGTGLCRKSEELTGCFAHLALQPPPGAVAKKLELEFNQQDPEEHEHEVTEVECSHEAETASPSGFHSVFPVYCDPDAQEELPCQRSRDVPPLRPPLSRKAGAAPLRTRASMRLPARPPHTKTTGSSQRSTEERDGAVEESSAAHHSSKFVSRQQQLLLQRSQGRGRRSTVGGGAVSPPLAGSSAPPSAVLTPIQSQCSQPRSGLSLLRDRKRSLRDGDEESGYDSVSPTPSMFQMFSPSASPRVSHSPILSSHSLPLAPSSTSALPPSTSSPRPPAFTTASMMSSPLSRSGGLRVVEDPNCPPFPSGKTESLLAAGKTTSGGVVWGASFPVQRPIEPRHKRIKGENKRIK